MTNCFVACSILLHIKTFYLLLEVKMWLVTVIKFGYDFVNVAVLFGKSVSLALRYMYLTCTLSVLFVLKTVARVR